MDVEALVRPVVEAAGMELVEAVLGRERGRRVLRVTVDREGGVDLDAISEVSERISRRLDLEGFDPGAGPYSLEVSSPGLERPLREPRDFRRRVGERVRVRTKEPVGGARTHEGRLAAADEEAIVVAAGGGERRIAYAEIRSARVVVDWESELRSRK
ncbi:MAG TPA: ribosome maturation factor RimP [Actinomycetota bacterium]|nr:ribosome maturation factor RimP [Actinomycetota bacterium]